WTVEAWPAAAKPEAAKPEAAKPAPAAAAPVAPVVPVNVAPQAAWASPAAVRAVSLSADGQRLAVTSDDSLIRVWDRGSTKEMQRFAGHTGVIHAVSFAPDGRSLATAGADKTVQWWALSVSQIAVAHQGAVQAIRYSRDGKRIYTAGADKVVRQWDAVTLAKGREYLGAEAAVKCLAVSSDERTIAAGGDDLAVRLWTVADGQSQGVIKLPTAISSVALAGQLADRQVVVASADAIVRTFARELPAANVVVGNAPAANAPAANAPAANAPAANVTAKPGEPGTWQLILESRGHTAAVTRLQLTADERSLFTAGVDQTVRRWQIPSLAPRWQSKSSEQPVYGLSFNADGSRLAVAGGDGGVQVVQAADGMMIWSKREHVGAAQAVAFHPGGKELVSAGADGKVRFWDEQGQLLKTGAAEAAGRLLTVAYSPDGNQVVTAGSAKTWQSLLRETLAVGRTGVGHNDTIYRLSYNPAGSRIATLDYGGHLFIWDMSNGNLLHHQQLPVTAAFGLAYAPDGTELLIASRDSRVLRWSIPAAVR
ncbi:MAG: WD40 repeat domain-containing protein, partial [Planctomycetota bacterium]